MPFINSNETKLYYKEFGTGNPILVLHGGPGVDHKYMLNLKALAKYYRLIFVDQRGNGKSKITNYNTLTFKYFTSDLDNIREYLKIDKWIVIGHSFGGFVALEYVLRYAQCVSQLVLIDTGFNAIQVQEEAPKILLKWDYPEKVSKWAHKFFNGNISLFQIPYVFLKFGKAYFYRYNIKIFMKSISGKHTLKTVHLWFREYFVGWDIKNKLSLIENPTLIISGENDFQFPPNYQRIMAKRINNSQLCIIEKAGHNTPIECPDELISLMLSFFKNKTA